MLENAELALVLRLLPKRRDFIVLDYRRPDGPDAVSVAVRAWAANGLVCRPRYDGPLPAVDVLKHDLLDTQPVLITGAAAPPDDLLAALAGLPTLRVESRGDRLLRGGRPLEDFPEAESRAGTTSLVVTGRVPVELSAVDLPATVRVRHAPLANRNLVRISGHNPFDELPPPRWFRLTGGGWADLTVDVRVGPEGDFWHVQVAGGACAAAPDPAVRTPLSHLSLVFDRTCPDRDHWSEARLLLLNPAALASVDPTLLGKAADSVVKPRDYNRAVRTGLAEALRDLPGAAELPVQVAWFADRPDGMADQEIQDIDLPPKVAGYNGERPASEADDQLRGCTYVPGLDLWDPLEEGLRLAFEHLPERPRPGTAVLIVGNSPPNLPLQADSPLRKLLTFAHVGTTTRRRNALFTDLVRRIADAGVPLVYLFLTHDRWQKDDASDQTDYRNLHEEVRKALSAYLPVTPTPADGPNIAAGLARARELLETPPVSGVDVRRPEVL